MNTQNSAPCSAEIIPFPGPARRRGKAKTATQANAKPPAKTTAKPEVIAVAPSERLHQALEALIAAQTEQRAALERWKDSLGRLQHGVDQLGKSVRQCEKALIDVAPPARAR
jgi:hypothetical protein